MEPKTMSDQVTTTTPADAQNELSTRRAVLTASATCLLEQATPLSAGSLSLQAEPNQALRALLADAVSCANACLGVVKPIFFGASYLPPVQLVFGYSQPKENDKPVTAEKLTAGEALLALATQAFEISQERYAQYQQVSNTWHDDSGEVLQLPAPDVDSEGFRTQLAEQMASYDDATARFTTLKSRHYELLNRHGQRCGGAGIYLEAAEGLLKGFGEDLQIARGEQINVAGDWEAEKAKGLKAMEDAGPEAVFVKDFVELIADALGAEGINGLVNAELGVDSPGSRVGFLNSATTEGKLAHMALDMLLHELAVIEPVMPPAPCWYGATEAPATEGGDSEAPQA